MTAFLVLSIVAAWFAAAIIVAAIFHLLRTRHTGGRQ